MNKRYVRYYLASFVSVITFALYLFALRNEFVTWDDSIYVYENFYIRSLNWTFFKWALTDTSLLYWHPLAKISHAVDYALWGLNPAGHHLTSIILHAVNTWIVIFLVIRLLRVSKSRLMSSLDDRDVLIVGSVTGLLFGLHPLHVESVAWIAERKDLLYSLFFMLSVIMYLTYVTGANEKEVSGPAFPNKHYLCSLAFFALSLESKPMAVTLPAVLLILDWYPLRRMVSGKSIVPLVKEKIPFIALSLILSIVTYAAQKSFGATELISGVPFTGRVLVAFRSLALYLWKMVVPLRLVPLYPYPKDMSLLSFEYLSAIAVVCGITAPCIIKLKKQKIFFAAWAYFVITLLPVIGIVQVGYHFMADRFTYLPGLGPFLLAGLTAAWVWRKADTIRQRGKALKVVTTALAIVLCMFMSYKTVKQIGIWKSSIDLWSYVIEQNPDPIPTAHLNRGTAYSYMGRLDRAIEDFTVTISLDPDDVMALNNRGLAFQQSGQYDRAIDDYTKAIEADPDSPVAFNNRGMVYRETGQVGRALEDFNASICVDPDYPEAYSNRGWVYKELGQPDRAMEDFNKAIALDPLYADGYNNRGLLLFEMGDLDRSLADYTKAIQLDPYSSSAYTNRGLLYERLQQIDRAMNDYTMAITVDPAFSNAWNNRGLIFQRMGQLDRALEDFNEAIKCNPSSIEAYNNRGIVYEYMGQYDRALQDYEKAIELDPSDHLVYRDRAIAFTKMGRIKDAIEDYTMVLSLDPGLVQVYLDRADLYLKVGRTVDAMKDFSKACDSGLRSGCDRMSSLKEQ